MMKNVAPKIRVELVLIFDNDTKMQMVTQEIGLLPTACKDKENQRKSPFSGEKMEAYWRFSTGNRRTFCLEEVTGAIVAEIKPYLKKVKKILERCDGEAKFYVVSIFSSFYTPALYMNQEFLEVVNFLGAPVELDVYVEEDF